MKFDPINYITANRQLGLALATALEIYHINFKRANLQATKNYGPLAPLFFSESALLSQDHEGKLNFYNFSAARVFGYSPDEAIGMPSVNLVPLELRTGRAEEFKRILTHGEAVELTEERITKEGKRVRINALVFPYQLEINPSIAARVELCGADGKRVVPLRI